MKGYTFHAEMPTEWRSKSGCKTHPPFTRKNIKSMQRDGVLCNVVAVCLGREHFMSHAGAGPSVEAFVSVFDRDDSDVNFGSASLDYLRSRTVRIDEATARKCHPALFRRLDD